MSAIVIATSVGFELLGSNTSEQFNGKYVSYLPIPIGSRQPWKNWRISALLIAARVGFRGIIKVRELKEIVQRWQKKDLGIVMNRLRPN